MTTRLCLHFVRFSGDEYNRARSVFGNPDFVHRLWDRRAQRDVYPGDTVVFAKGDADQPLSKFSANNMFEIY